MRVPVWFAPTFAGMVHDRYAWYQNTVPFCGFGLQTWCEAAPPDRAQFALIGQVREDTPRPFKLPDCWGLAPIVDIEGDHILETFGSDLDECVRISCGAPLAWKGSACFPRPTMSRFLVWAARNLYYNFSPAKTQALGFRGKEDSRGIRWRLAKAAVGLPGVVALNREWHGPTELGHPARQAFQEDMLASSIALCPMGEGVATARFYEACLYARFPVIVGKTLVLGDGYADTSFAYQMPETLGYEELRAELEQLLNMPLAEVRERGRAARHYFDTTVRSYFADPTKAFLDWYRGRQ